ncbi:uncharacterized protein EDB93DRAFT_1100061 [Suillus bovinus]|uniref:uncharacterized protein n=1 Tax=Suillus bovinus TaxID=48563 RepID=UPI001B86BDAA|nr:uncharacterized protein EDB93DRAFT_1100061 [Suillus bovinus]KAG2159003.1 hypothetical protein EDB93DRAFT_1100061 [Suillus bovinus]
MTDNRPNPPPQTSEITVPESSNQLSSRVKLGWKFVKNIIKKLSKRFKRSRNRIPAIQNVELQGASSSENIQDTLHPHLFTDNTHLTPAENLSECVNQGTSGEPASKVLDVPCGSEETPGSKPVSAELQVAHEALEHMKTPLRPAQHAISAVSNAPAGLTAVDNLQTDYLQPLKIFNTAIDKIANVHPYAKMALGVLSAAANIILTQAERDKSINDLLKKLDEVYGFITQDDNLSKVESMRDVIGKIAQQTLECARFIREYSETKSFCESSNYCIRKPVLYSL